MRFKVAEQEDMSKGFDIHDEYAAAAALSKSGWPRWASTVIERDDATEYAYLPHPV